MPLAFAGASFGAAFFCAVSCFLPVSCFLLVSCFFGCAFLACARCIDASTGWADAAFCDGRQDTTPETTMAETTKRALVRRIRTPACELPPGNCHGANLPD